MPMCGSQRGLVSLGAPRRDDDVTATIDRRERTGEESDYQRVPAAAAAARLGGATVRQICESTIYSLLRDGAAAWPDRVLVRTEDGDEWTWTQALHEGARAAAALADFGVARDTRVMLPLPNGPAWLRAWWGTTLLGAVVVPVNPNLRGPLLEDVCTLVDPAAIIAEEPMAQLLPSSHAARRMTPAQLTAANVTAFAELDPPPQPWDTHCLLMTSGTTGPSKASITTHAYVIEFLAWMIDECDLGPDDVFQADTPWFHLSSFGPAVQMMRVGGRIALRTKPAMSQYWSTASQLGSTFAVQPGTVSQFLAAQPPSAADRDHRLRFLHCSPLPADPAAYIDRFGLSGLATGYGSTEANLPVVAGLRTPQRVNSCGKARDGYEIRLVDEHDHAVAPGAVGELIVRTDKPWLQTQGYFRRPEDTIRLLRNGWIHTGDAMRMDVDGYLYFHDRYKDALRRRGENISSFEVERAVAVHPSVAEVACVGHPDDYGSDDEVKVFIVVREGLKFDVEQLLQFLVDELPRHMVPRYFEVVDELPKTPTQRIQKHVLRERGNSAATWDRDAVGFQLTRSGLVRPPR
jgi:carnitine-CoA ligase